MTRISPAAETPAFAGEDSLFSPSPVYGRYGMLYSGRTPDLRVSVPGYVLFDAGQNYFDARRFFSLGHDIMDWNFETGGPVLSSAALSGDGILYFGCNDSSLYALTQRGELLWKFAAGAAVVSSPALGEDGTIYFGCKDGFLYALDRAGNLRWRYGTRGGIVASPALALDGAVYIGSRDSSFYALAPAGELLWSYATEGGINSSAAVALDGTIYFGSNDSCLYALDPQGSLKWRYRTGAEIISSPALGADGTVFFGSGDSSFYALRPDGSLKWRNRAEQKVWFSPVVDFDGAIHVGTNNLVFRGTQGDTILIQAGITFTDDGLLQGWGKSIGSGATTYAIGPDRAVYSRSGRANGRGQSGQTQSGGYTFEGCSWPKFRHDYRNTGNAATALDIPRGICDISGNGIISIADVVYLLKSIRSPWSAYPDSEFVNGVLQTQMIHLRQLIQDIFYGDCQESGTNLASLSGLEAGEEPRLTAEEARYLEELIAGLDLNPEEETLLRKAIFGESGMEQPAGLPRAFSLGRNFPNPFNPATTISFEVPLGARETVSLKVYDLRGKLVRVLADTEKPAGSYTVFWDGKDESGRSAASGVYLCRMKAGSFSQNRKMVLLK